MATFEDAGLSKEMSEHLQKTLEVNMPSLTEFYARYTADPGAWIDAAPNSAASAILGLAGIPYSVMRILYPMLPPGDALIDADQRGRVMSMVAGLQDLILILREPDGEIKQRKLQAITEFLHFRPEKGDLIKGEREIFSVETSNLTEHERWNYSNSIVNVIRAEREAYLPTLYKPASTNPKP